MRLAVTLFRTFIVTSVQLTLDVAPVLFKFAGYFVLDELVISGTP